MNEDIQKIIDDQVLILPEDIRDVLKTSDYKTKLTDIYKRQRLLIDQAEKLQNETVFVLIGLERLADFVKNIVRSLGVTEIKAQEIALDVDENIFKPIRESIRKIDPHSGEPLVAESVPEEENTITPEPLPPTVVNLTEKREEVPEIDTSHIGLHRDTILDEIENPHKIGRNVQSPQTFNLNQVVANTVVPPKNPLDSQATNKLADPNLVTPPKAETPGQITTAPVIPKVVVPLNTTPADIFDLKFGQSVRTERVTKEVGEKLPPLKTRPTDGTDPYREPIK